MVRATVTSCLRIRSYSDRQRANLNLLASSAEISQAIPSNGGCDERASDAAQEAVSTVTQSIWMSSLPLVPAGQPLECEHSCCSTVVRSTSGTVVESPAYVQTGVDMSSK